MTEKNRAVLITGANGGIGRASVGEFARQDWRVYGVDRDVLSFVFPKDGTFIQTDISDPKNIED
jgi:NAD(P)-dependent dehydrogenase (short-subunit alcohol dehydrogenase family)